MNWSLPVTLKTDPLLHERTDLESVSDGRVWKLGGKTDQQSLSLALSSSSLEPSRMLSRKNPKNGEALYFSLVALRKGLTSSDDSDPSSLPHGEDTLVDGLQDVRLEHESLLDGMKPRFRLMKRPAVESDIESLGEELEDFLDDVLSSRRVDSDDLVGSGLLDGEVDSILGVGGGRGKDK